MEDIKKDYVKFEHTLRFLEVHVGDNMFLDDIKQTIIVYSLKDKVGEDNEVFLDNLKSQFYESIGHLKYTYPSDSYKYDIIKDFVEKYLFIKDEV